MGETLISKLRNKLQDTNLIFWWYEKLFKLFGYWPTEETGLLFFVHKLFIFGTIIGTCLAPVMIFAPELDNLVELGIAGNGLAMSTIVLSYTLVMYLQKDDIKSSVVNLARFWPLEESMSAVEIDIRKTIQRKNTQTFTALLIIVFEIIVGLLLMGAEILKTRKYPMKLWVPYDASVSPYFELSFLFAAPFFVLNSLLMPWAMFYQYFCCSFLIAEFKVLGSKIENIRAKSVENVAVCSFMKENLIESTPQIQSDEEVGDARKLSGVLQLQNQGKQGKSSLILQPIQKEDVLTEREPGAHRTQPNEQGLDATDLSGEWQLESQTELQSLLSAKDNSLLTERDMMCEKRSVAGSLDDIPGETELSASINPDTLIDNEMIRLLVQYIQEHQIFLEYLSQHEGLFGAMLLSDTLFSLITCVLTTFVSKKISPEERDAPYLLVVMITVGMLHVLWIKCSRVDELSSVTSDVRDSAYACEWQDSSEEFKRCLRILITRANVPYVLSGLGFVDFSVKTFDAVINTVYSYYTVITNLDKLSET